MCPGFFKLGIGFAYFKHHPDDSQVAILVGMHKVGIHGVELAVNSVFTGSVDMELFQFKGFIAHLHGAALYIIDLDGMTIVDDIFAAGLVIQFQ